MRRFWSGLGLAMLVFSAGVVAEEKRYSVEIFDRQKSVYEIPIEIEFEGNLEIVADWEGSRTLSFRLDSPDGTIPSIRKSGPPPIRLKVPVPLHAAGGEAWKLTIRALPMRGASLGVVAVRTPRNPVILARERAAEERQRRVAAVPTRERWEQPRLAPSNSSPQLVTLANSTEEFRSWIIEGKQTPDSCRWQEEFLRWMSSQRDLALDEDHIVATSTGKLLERIAEVVVEVEELRQSKSRTIVGPVPLDEAARTQWLRQRARHLAPIEDHLDYLMQSIQREYAPELSDQAWPMRMVSCVMASERYFEQRWLVGEDRAMNRELAEAQAEPLARAGRALGALAALAEEAPIRLGAPRR